jgi:hypothetical protein
MSFSVVGPVGTDLPSVGQLILAQQKGHTRDVKKLWPNLEQDQSQHLEKAKQTAQQMGVAPRPSPMRSKRKCTIS